jgi:hypothetical protein
VSISTDRQNRSKADYQTFALPVGPAVDILPEVSPDRKRIHLTLVPSWTEFLGYDAPAPGAPDGLFDGDKLGPPLEVQRPLPHFRARQTRVAADVADGETIVISGFPAAAGTRLGAAPGKASPIDSISKRQLVVFVTTKLIDPAGNRLNPE